MSALPQPWISSLLGGGLLALRRRTRLGLLFLSLPPLVVEAIAHASLLNQFPALYLLVLILAATYVVGSLAGLLVTCETLVSMLVLNERFERHATPSGVLAAMLVVVVVSLTFGRAFARERDSRANAEAGEIRFRHILDGAQVGLIVIDSASGLIELVNPAFCTISGLAESELIGQPPGALEGARLSVLESEVMPTLLERELPYVRTNTVIVRPDGELVFVEIVATVVERPGGITQLVATIADRTASVRAQDELSESESRYRRLLETAFEGVVLAVNGTIVDADSGFARLSGYDAAELVGLPISALSSSAAGAFVSAAGKTGSSRRLEGALVRKDRIELPIEAVSQDVAYGGRAARLTAVNDIRKRRHAEEERAAAERRYRALFDSAAVGVALSTIDGTLIEANAMLASMLGHSREQIAGRTHASFQDPRAPVGSDERDALLRGERGSYTIEHDLLRADGSLLPVRISESLVHDDRGRPLYTVSVLESIAERRALEEEIRQTQKMEAVGRLAGGIAHDFNNLLTVISGQAALTGSNELPQRARESLAEIEEAARRAAALTRQLLAFSRKQVMRPQKINVNHSIRELERLLRRVLPRNITIELQLDADPALVRADPGQFDQVLMNLAINARDAMPGGGTLTIGTSAVALSEAHGELAPGEYVSLAVSDSGVGIAESVRERIFEPFFTTKRVGEGTGLGLATVYGIVRQSGGEVSVESEPHHGATFTVLLPVAEPGVPDACEAGVRTPFAAAHARGGRILLVEDDPSVRRFAGDVLAGDGHHVSTAANAEEALELLDRAPSPDVLVTDLVMPGMSGRELARHVRARHPGIAILYISGFAGDTLARLGELEEETELLAKPFAPRTLVAKVADAVSASRDR